MRRKLVIINAALLAAAGVGLWQFRVQYRQALERYRILEPAASPALPAPPQQPSAISQAQPAAYLDAAEKHLFSPDRNPTVVVEPPKVKPRPELPQLYGVMNIGGGPIAIMAPEPNARHKTVRPGETIGEFKLLAAAGDRITLEWEGERIDAQVSDLLVRPPAAAASGGSEPAAAPGTPGGASATVLNPSAEGRPGDYKIGPPVQGATGVIYQSLPGDTAPHGTVFQGKRKVVRTTPFGQQSWWEDVR